jgi:hypothetical protein
MRAFAPPDDKPREPSWKTALSEAEAAQRHLRLATASIERLINELRSLRAWDGRMARIEVARRLVAGADGGLLTLLVGTASDERLDTRTRRAASVILERLTTALGLGPLAVKGERLSLLLSQLTEFEVRGAPPSLSETRRSLYSVVRPGWTLDGMLLSPPLLEPVGEGPSTRQRQDACG